MSDSEISPILFIGIADHVNQRGQPFPIGPIDLFQLSQHKSHIIYPAITTDNEYVFLLHKDVLDPEKIQNLSIKVFYDDGTEFSSINVGFVGEPDAASKVAEEKKQAGTLPIVKGASSMLFHVKLDSLINRPGRYIIKASLGGEFEQIGEIYFHYSPAPPLTPDQIKAIESDPRSVKAFRMDLGCKFCDKKLYVYTALEQINTLEEDGYVWQYNLSDNFECDCGRTQYSLSYIKESLHGLLLKNLSTDIAGLGYVRRYAHEQIVEVIRNYEDLLKTEKDEKPFQNYIEKHPIMLARFHAKRLFIKPNILGKFETDFALLDTRNQLILIELEKPSLKLFKKDGHPAAELMHAYGQVRDWLHEYSKHPAAVLEGLKLQDEKVFAVRGVVIAGKRSEDITSSLQRHLSYPPYSDIDFLTLDDLSNSLFEISRKLI